MSKIDDLIVECCGDGVVFKELGKVLKPKENISWKLNRNKSYQYIDLSSVDRITHKISETAEINFENAPSRAQQIVKNGDVIFGTTRPTLKRYCIIDDLYDGQIASTGFCVLRPNDEILSNFLYHLMGSYGFNEYVENTQKGASYPSISDAEIKKYKIPVPPIEVQKEILNILDKFTQLEAELEAELEARKKQYEHYRNHLLSFKVDELNWTTLAEVSVDTFWIMPATPKFSEDGEVPYITSKNIKNSNIDFSRIKNISRSDYDSISKNRPIIVDDILISMIGTIGEVARVKDTDLPFYGQNMYLVRLNKELIDTNYFLHFFDSKKMKAYFTSIKNNSGQGYLKANHIESIKIPLPPLDKQKKIAIVLDRFDKLVHSISEGLPAELNARRKQYEYYRDKLLTFEELKV